MPKRFKQLPFELIAESPRIPHGYSLSEPRELMIDSANFGRMRIHYRRFGRGEPLLLIHGLMTSSYSWRYVLQALGEHFELFMPDLPGNGLTDKPRNGSFQVRDLAEWIGEFQRALDLEGCKAVGNSMGGFLCMQLALARPRSFSRLVNLHSPGLPIFRMQALAWALKIPGAKTLLQRAILRDPYRWAHRHVHYFDESLKSQEESRAYGDPLSTPDGAWSLVRYLAETFDPRGLHAFERQLRERLARQVCFPVPLLLVYAHEDPMVPPVIGTRLHRLLPESSLVWLADTSHFMHVDSPERVVPLLLGFLQDKGLVAP